jgi:outer membrane protein assembly factor BamB
MDNRRLTLIVLFLGTLGSLSHADDGLKPSEDWPMWRYDAQRSAASPNLIPEKLHLLWKLSLPERTPVWDDPLNQDLMSYDSQLEPIVLGGRLMIGLNDRDQLVALDAQSGQLLWRFFAEAPIRLPPVGWRDRVFVCSDDGFLYCLQADSGKELWRFSKAPSQQHAIGNRRITSAWPARGGPVVRDGTVYFAASIWPFMGTFIHALDAETGQVQWTNDSTGSQYIKQPHSAPSFAGVAPQGALVATQDQLIVPGGRSVPAVFERQNGRLKYFEIDAGGKGTGGSFVAVDQVHFYVHTRGQGTRAFNLATGLKTAFMPNQPVIWSNYLFSAESDGDQPCISAYQANVESDKSREPVWKLDVDGRDDLIVAGNHLVAAGGGQLSVIRLPSPQEAVLVGGKVVQQIPIPDKIARLLVADRKLFVVTRSGDLHVFGSLPEPSSQQGNPNQAAVKEINLTGNTEISHAATDPVAIEQVKRLLSIGQAEGYAFWYGNCEPSLLTAWSELSPFVQLAIIDSDLQRVDAARRHVDSLGAYGSKITVHHAEPTTFRPPQYVANMIFVSAQLAATADAADLQAIFQAVRPYGGSMVVLSDDAMKTALSERMIAAKLENATISHHAEALIARREGPLPGSAPWNHQHGDIANSVKSNDSRVKLPLGILWFGGVSNTDVLPRHGHGPSQQVVSGRLILQGHTSLSARDVYTGRLLWHRDFGDLGTFDVYFDTTYENTPLDPKYNQVHIPGANARGTNYVVTQDRVYLVIGNRCMILDASSGTDVGEIKLPQDAAGNDREWGFIGVYRDVLLGGVGFAKYKERHSLEFDSDKLLKGSKAGFSSKSLDRAASRALVGFDLNTGKQLWQVEASCSFWHNGIVAGGNRIYCLDRHPTIVEEALKRRGVTDSVGNRILSIDYRTGDTLWEIRENIFGTWLGYSEQYDLLLQAGARASDRLADEAGKGMRVYHAADGSLKWAKDDLAYNGPCILHNQLIITNTNAYSKSAGAFDIRDGQQRMTKNPLTGQSTPWQITRTYGCNKIIASENLLTFRSGAAGYYDLLTEAGTGNLGGFKSGCTSNLIVADGVLSAPDYTRTCSCAYQNQTSLGLVHFPDMDTWTINLTATTTPPDVMIDSIGVNLGAPGDRRDEHGTLWVEYPNVAGDPLPISVSLNQGAQLFQQHSSTFADSPLPWVFASGATNVSEVRVRMLTQKPEAAKESSGKPSSEDGEPVNEGASDDKVQAGVPAEVVQGESHLNSIYDVELFFGLPEQLKSGEAHTFEVSIVGSQASQTINLGNPRPLARDQSEGHGGATGLYATCKFSAIEVQNQELVIQLKSQQGTATLSGIRILRTAQ